MQSGIWRKAGTLAAAAGAGLCFCLDPAQALGECGRFGATPYTAERAVDIAGQTIRSHIYSQGAMEREDVTINGRLETRLVSRDRIVTYNLVTKTGFVQRLPAAPRAKKEDARVRVENAGAAKKLTLELRDAKGDWQLIESTTCRADGVPLARTFTVTGQGAITTGQMTQSIVSTGKLDAALFKVPADVKLKN